MRSAGRGFGEAGFTRGAPLTVSLERGVGRRDFEAGGELVIYEEFGQDIVEIAELAQHITTRDCSTLWH